jgi:nitrite reductase/ring-hydroxylating ferredoxin subunit
LKIHKVASFAILPLFATELVLGQSLYDDGGSGAKKGAHVAVGVGIGTLFGINLGDIDAVAAQGGERRYPLPSADGVVIDKDATAGLARYQGKVFALSLACPHQRAAVRWLATAQRFQCSKHDSKYQPTGTYTSGRAARNLDRFPIRRDGDTLVVDVTRVFKSDQDAAAWNNSAIQV